jgi:hypothetical protein
MFVLGAKKFISCPFQRNTIFAVVSHSFEAWSRTPREEYRPRLFENGVLRRR